MIEEYLKTTSWYSECILQKPAKQLADLFSSISLQNLANLVTIFGGLLGLSAAGLIMVAPIWAVVCLGASGYCDMLDGQLARLSPSKSSNMGAMYDLVIDRLVESAIIIGLYWRTPDKGLWCLLMLACILICVTTFLVTGIFAQNNTNKSFYYSPGLIERAEAFIFFGAMILLPEHFASLAALFCVLVIFTSIKRIKDLALSAR